MERLQNKVMGYDWGSRTAIAELLGRPLPSAEPEAEMWIGAHASAPSLVVSGADRRTLDVRIADRPDSDLGPNVRGLFGDRLPFLLKVLAAEVPLSLQAHPSLEQARAGYAREEALGIARTARARNYKDSSPKPEILCALGPFEALCGFRRVRETLDLLESLDVDGLGPVLSMLRKDPGPAGLRAAFGFLMNLGEAPAAALVTDVVAACRLEAGKGGSARAQLEWVTALSRRYAGDVGVVASLLLNHVRLEAGDAVYLPAGNLHSYLRGTGIELMAASDNVLRGGLTSKHVDVAELMAVLDFTDRPFEPVPVHRVCDHETEYVTEAPDFRLSRIRVAAGQVCRPARRGPELLLCVEGHADAASARGAATTLEKGASVFVPASDADYSLTGDALLFRAAVGTLAR